MAQQQRPEPESAWWLMGLAGLGIVGCCGGPLVVGWLTSLGIAATVGAWWSQAHGWMAGGGVAVAGGLSLWLLRRWRRMARGRWLASDPGAAGWAKGAKVR